jgi:hypothetical protein
MFSSKYGRAARLRIDVFRMCFARNINIENTRADLFILNFLLNCAYILHQAPCVCFLMMFCFM